MVSRVCVIFTFVLLEVFVALASHEFNFNDRNHLQDHTRGELDLSFVSAQDLQFLYFQSHDTEANNKLDGCELVQSLLHFHTEESDAHGQPPKVFSDSELSMMVDPLLSDADMNKDGFIDYPEFISGRIPGGF